MSVKMPTNFAITFNDISFSMGIAAFLRDTGHKLAGEIPVAHQTRKEKLLANLIHNDFPGG